jgi:hypothetical protein
MQDPGRAIAYPALRLVVDAEGNNLDAGPKDCGQALNPLAKVRLT